MARQGTGIERTMLKKQRKLTKYIRVGDYLRLSVDSDYTGATPLENQRKPAQEYISRRPDLNIVKRIC